MDYYLRTDIQYSKEDKENYKKLKSQQEIQEVSNQEWQRGDWEYVSLPECWTELHPHFVL